MTLLCNINNNIRERERDVQVHTMLPDVLDSCMQTDEITRDLLLTNSPIFDGVVPVIGMAVPVCMAGNVGFQEVAREKEDCCCISSAMFGIPIILGSVNSCICPPEQEFHTLSVVRSASLSCSNNSTLSAPVKDVLLLRAFVTDVDIVDDDELVTVSCSCILRTELQQSVMREFILRATPVCNIPECRVTIPHDNCCDNRGCPRDESCGNNNRVLGRNGLERRRFELV